MVSAAFGVVLTTVVAARQAISWPSALVVRKSIVMQCLLCGQKQTSSERQLLTHLRHEHPMICAARMAAVHHSPRRPFLMAEYLERVAICRALATTMSPTTATATPPPGSRQTRARGRSMRCAYSLTSADSGRDYKRDSFCCRLSVDTAMVDTRE